ncbi:MAG: cation transporter [Stigonema ocellatum SAG 48.90 = DSM 106950]|nr:cation transporter [Stigonema ocellatum SAG 48.90 = DSM 106950]
MTLSIQEQSSTRGAVIRPGCGCSNLRDLDIVQRKQKTQVLWINLGLLLSFFAAELATGLWSHSLSLLADAEHLVSDIAALGLTLLACWVAQRRAAGQATFAYGRVEVLVALVNGLSLLAIATFIAWEAIERIQTPELLLGLPMLIGAGIGLVVNSLNICLLHQHSHDDINLRGAFLHMVADAISSVGVIIAALAVYFLNWLWIDPIASLFVAGLTALGAIPLVRESVEILMEYAPRSIKPAEVTASLKSFPGVYGVEKLHIWTITSGQVMLCAHLIVQSLNAHERDRLLKQLQAHLKQEHGIGESILQLTSRDYTESIALHPLFNNNLVDLIKL